MIKAAEMQGWRVAHFGNTVRIVRGRDGTHKTIPDRQARGFPDLVLVRPPTLIFAELKLDKTRLTEPQEEWQDLLNALDNQHIVVTVWRPQDWDLIQAVLRI